MSDFRAIGGVSASLQALLQDRMDLPDGVTSVPITISTPRLAKDDVPVKEDPRVNLFLYRVGENAYLQSQEIPGQGNSGAFGFPPLSLNLHYLVTAFGSQTVSDTSAYFDETIAQFLLGSAMRVLRDYAVLTEELLTTKPPIGAQILHPSLLGAYEKVKLTLEPVSLEDATKVWVALTLRYRLSAAYSITVVQIESKSKRTFPRLVGAPPSIYPPLSPFPAVPGPYIPVNVFSSPFLSNVYVRRLGSTVEQQYAFASVGDTLILLGSGFSGSQVSASLDNVMVPVTPLTPNRIEVVVPDAVIPGVGPISPIDILEPGSQPVAVVIANPQFPQAAVRSNNSAFVLVPKITAPVAYSAGPPRSITINGNRLYSPTLSGETIVGRASVDKQLYRSPASSSIVVNLPDLLPSNAVKMLVSSPLPDPFPLPANPQMKVTIAGNLASVTLQATSPVPLANLPAILTAAIQDGGSAIAPQMPPEFIGLQCALFGSQLVLVAGGLTASITATDGPGTLASALKLTSPQPPGASNGYLSGDLSIFPTFPGSTAALTASAGGGPGTVIKFASPTYIDVAAQALQTALQPVSAGAKVGVLGTQLLILPGAATKLAFGTTSSDATSVLLLQLHGLYNVRVRVNGSDSIDDISVELPQ